MNDDDMTTPVADDAAGDMTDDAMVDEDDEDLEDGEEDEEDEDDELPE